MAKIKWGKRQESDYSSENAKADWTYDGSINHANPFASSEAVEYLSKNIPYLKRQMDNTEYLDVMAFAATKVHGLKAWKKAIDGYIREYDPMNRGNRDISVHDPKGGWMDAGSLHEWLEKELPWHDSMSWEQASSEWSAASKQRREHINKSKNNVSDSSQRARSQRGLDQMFSEDYKG
tara:strand:+ start:506 stop:1039 length:534 start_codon:yes stop_codon:yes gene_type:complete